ncbi:MAG TPA: choice-of-anchor Q domain-containing protein [Actinomycetota bacterium]|nr:choice-of-anchor Q domain-containing protein [Actinomycetota bacterium]
MALARTSLAVVAAAVALTASTLVADTPGATAGTQTLLVNTTTDTFDAVCDEDCSLRDAIAAAGPGGRVRVPSGFYTLTRTGHGGIGRGDIDLRASITIAGVGETGTFIDASQLGERAFTMGTASADGRYELRRLTIFGARAPSIDGAAARLGGGSARLRRVTIVGSRGGDGGALWSAPRSSLHVFDSLLIDNAASRAGGAIHSRGRLVMIGTTVAGNRAADGGGIAVAGNGGTIERSTIAENVATSSGGGMYIASAATLDGVTVADNRAGRGGGIRRPASAPGEVSVSGSVLSDNEADRSVDCAAAIVSLGGNAGFAKGCGLRSSEDHTGVDPRLRRLGAYGGPTPTMALRIDSPALGAAGRCDSHADQRGAPRDRRCDAGAYELVRCLGKPVNIVGTRGDDELSGGRRPDVFLGLGGDDEFQGSIGNDRACGGAGHDLLIAGPGNDRFDGGPGNDRIEGEEGDDWVWGGPGRDRLVGGPGMDTCQSERRDREPKGCEIFAVAIARATDRPGSPI